MEQIQVGGRKESGLEILSPEYWSLLREENGLEEPAFVHCSIAIMVNMTRILTLTWHEKPTCLGEN